MLERATSPHWLFLPWRGVGQPRISHCIFCFPMLSSFALGQIYATYYFPIQWFVNVSVNLHKSTFPMPGQSRPKGKYQVLFCPLQGSYPIILPTTQLSWNCDPFYSWGYKSSATRSVQRSAFLPTTDKEANYFSINLRSIRIKIKITSLDRESWALLFS